MLDESKHKLLADLVNNCTREELGWISGYLAGLLKGPAGAGLEGSLNMPAEAITVAASTSTKKITLAYGTETGNAKRLATKLAASAKKQGINLRLSSLETYRPADLAKEKYFFVIISTQGEGEPPIPAQAFYDHLVQAKLSLPSLQYSVLALGDTSYPLYCKTGEDVDAAFEQHGSKRVLPLQRCDVDYEADAEAWFAGVLAKTKEQSAAGNTSITVNQTSLTNAGSNGNTVSAATGKSLSAVTSESLSAVTSESLSAAAGESSSAAAGESLSVPAGLPVAPTSKKATRKHYNGTITANVILNDRGSEKQTYHLEISTDEDIIYEAGDTIGIVPQNRKDVVQRIIELTGINPTEEVETTRVTASVEELLTRYLNICYLMGNTVKKYAAVTGHGIPDVRMDLVDLLRIYPVADAAQFATVIKLLLPISPRLYTAASSPSYHGLNQVHITVARDRFVAQDEQRFGLCSEFLGDQLPGTALTFYVHREKNFKMPPSSTDMIMIGPGTGIAPFRSFLAERDATGADGRNWLFFGERHFLTDFLYQAEIQAFVETGVLHKINLAFSRDQSHRIYVQHRIKANAAELFEWLEAGAHLYISGTKDPMAKDVEVCLLEVISQEGQLTAEEARAYLEQMEKTNRYQKDIY